MTKDQAGAEHEHVAPAETWPETTRVDGAEVGLHDGICADCGRNQSVRCLCGACLNQREIERDHNSRGKLLAALEAQRQRVERMAQEVDGDYVLALDTLGDLIHNAGVALDAALAEAHGERAGA